MGFLIFFFIVFIVIVFLLLVISKPSKHSPPPRYEHSAEEVYRVPSSRPKISAEVSEQLRSEVEEYCAQHSMTISDLVRRAIEAYIGSDSSSSSSVVSAPRTVQRMSNVIRPDGSWKCPRCGKINASYVGTCSCGVDKDSAPSMKASSRKPSYIREDGSWKCPKCGKINAKYVGTCSCGKTKE